MEEVGEEVERILGSNPRLHREAWHRIKGWYQAVFKRAPPPAQVTLERIAEERLDLYRYMPPQGRISPHQLIPSWWRSWYLWRIILSGR